MNRFSFNLIVIVTTFVVGLALTSFWRISRTEVAKPLTAEELIPLAGFLDKHSPQDKQSLDESSKPMLPMEALKVNDIALSESYSDILRQFGKPLRAKKAGSFGCSDTVMMTLNYTGLKIELDGDERGKSFTAASMEVTSPKWTISGIRIGADKKDVLAKFSNYSYHTETQNDLEYLYFGNGDGWINFYFRGDKLVKIRWEYNFC
ncbi:MAG TPA: hypothetical protein VGC76_15530 [Pyrinomonadaceae bacterium]|jgi:hypothetical protein